VLLTSRRPAVCCFLQNRWHNIVSKIGAARMFLSLVFPKPPWLARGVAG
jgi:hypothetical protein